MGDDPWDIFSSDSMVCIANDYSVVFSINRGSRSSQGTSDDIVIYTFGQWVSLCRGGYHVGAKRVQRPGFSYLFWCWSDDILFILSIREIFKWSIDLSRNIQFGARDRSYTLVCTLF